MGHAARCPVARAGLFLLGTCLLLAAAAPGAADEITAETRRAAERAFMQGRLGDLDAILAGATRPEDRLPLRLRDGWWRGPVDEGFRYPERAGGGEDPYPLLTALVADRVRREARGAAGLPEDGPLEIYWSERRDSLAQSDQEVFRWVYGMMVRSYRGDDDAVAVAELDQRSERLRNRNKLLWLVILGAFLVSCFFGVLLVARQRR